MKINETPLPELSSLNIIKYFEYGDDYDDFYMQPFSNCDQDIKVKYFDDLQSAEELFDKMVELLQVDSIIDQRVVVLLTKKDDNYIVGLLEEDQFSIWFEDVGIKIKWDKNECHSFIKNWINYF